MSTADMPDDEPLYEGLPDDDIGARDVAREPNRSRVRGSLVAAAMLGLGQVIEPEKTKVVIEQTNDDPFGDGTDLELNFDRLPPVDDP